QYLDCDVEEPNGHIFIKPSIRASSASKVMIPVVDQEKCTSCGARSPHTRGVPCFEQICPQCGSKMVRAS
nr:hypothetical protein [Syntrophorhabdaceae bacterium]